MEPDHERRVREFDDASREIAGYKVLPFPGENGARRTGHSSGPLPCWVGSTARFRTF